MTITFNVRVKNYFAVKYPYKIYSHWRCDFDDKTGEPLESNKIKMVSIKMTTDMIEEFSKDPNVISFKNFLEDVD